MWRLTLLISLSNSVTFPSASNLVNYLARDCLFFMSFEYCPQTMLYKDLIVAFKLLSSLIHCFTLSQYFISSNLEVRSMVVPSSIFIFLSFWSAGISTVGTSDLVNTTVIASMSRLRCNILILLLHLFFPQGRRWCC